MWYMNILYCVTGGFSPVLRLLLPKSLAAVLETVLPIHDYISWDFLGSVAGAVAATTLIVQFLKIPFDMVWKIHTRYVVYFIAFLLLFFVEFFTGHITLERILLIMLNAVIVAMASMGTYEVTFKQTEEKK